MISRSSEGVARRLSDCFLRWLESCHKTTYIYIYIYTYYNSDIYTCVYMNIYIYIYHLSRPPNSFLAVQVRIVVQRSAKNSELKFEDVV